MSAERPAASTPWYMESRGIEADVGGPHTLEDLGLDPMTKARVLEWYAFKIWVADNEGSGDQEYGGKSYDPLTIELDTRGGGVAHSYVFDFRDGGRHHVFHSLAELEEWLTEEAITSVKFGGEGDARA